MACANCHRMIHRSTDPRNLGKFRELVSQRKLKLAKPSGRAAIGEKPDSHNGRLRNIGAASPPESQATMFEAGAPTARR